MRWPPRRCGCASALPRPQTRGAMRWRIAPRPPDPRGVESLRSGVRRLADVCSLQALRSPSDVELDPLALGQGLESLALDRREMHEHVLAALLRDETEALRVVEPLHCTNRHFETPCFGDPRPPSMVRRSS